MKLSRRWFRINGRVFTRWEGWGCDATIGYDQFFPQPLAGYKTKGWLEKKLFVNGGFRRGRSEPG